MIMAINRTMIMKKYTYIFSVLLSACAAITFVSCDDEIEPIESLEFDRVLSPLALEAFVRDNTAIELKWKPSNEVDTYIVEFSEDSLEFSNIIFTDEVTEDEIPYRHTFAGETRYSARVKAVSEDDKADSKWSTVTIKTLPENIYEDLPLENVLVSTAALAWEAGSEVSHFLISPGGTQRPITTDEKAAGEATLEGLDAGTSYIVTLYNGNKIRGVVGFNTLLEVNVLASDNLVDRIAAANEGDVLVLESGTYEMGSVALTKSITIQGQKPFDKPVVYGQLTCGTTITTVTVKSLVFRGNGTTTFGQFFNSIAGCNLNSLTIDDCEISHFTNQIIYNEAAASGVYGTIKFKNSFFHDFVGSGGDGIDFRAGTIGSLQVENCTFANGFRTFLRMQIKCSTSFKNCTFYKISNYDNGNNHGLFRSHVEGTFGAVNCLFVETGVPTPAFATTGNFCRQASYMSTTATYDNNNIHSCYNLMVGLYTTPGQVDATTLDPGFADAANNDFTVSNQTIIDNNIGDPRWLH
jgi:hypothetical protein